MKSKKDLNSAIFINALIILFFFVYLVIVTRFVKIGCGGCILCGMTRAFRCIFKLDFSSAYEYNRYVFWALGIFAVLGFDMVASFTYLIIRKIKGGKKNGIDNLS